ncbi:helix-turn-helix transcriptional regulator [Anabaena cylindrica FACHB-243]|uniref:Transcriptional regulator, HxlR family n=1 Tax=Anabaena cylindrica (strain ATCC 27899 / PCC 7122) TaxID=272123 RepID=K9ZGZ3_ANACC|nr:MULTISPECIES: helix-turn-helix domain-containing protein [Anabaena]AFZ58456.1 transcriptional regulator, HxlR family [Anabaena cylindrica PCC 7122]MBD2417321.1 helix-turn-helix transcriptional regulator [Anabaena cylindrica FACHB-243]MBY5282429.1 helix-turn-helix transcriptional regulator [Anabaena sp. CCAP 1446/1C]MBY5308772.1 helix-turn-helix transcriptional regulator [Anabaena sp. CCAP 1446/1C]MCM2410116.1 helix-turn-helix transcriptional regulator [Anabaena sp. CCAP 1446/1C]
MVPNNEQIILGADCPMRQMLDLLGDKWTPPVLYLLSSGTKRYTDFQRQIPGISKKMLTQTLRRLESAGVVNRTVYPIVPPKVEYNLTPFGEKLIEPIAGLAEWAWQHQEELKLVSERQQMSLSSQKLKL